MAYTSRLRKHEGRQAIMYVVLSVLFILFMIKWGVPVLIQVLSKDRKETSGSKSGIDIRIQPPVLSNLPEATFSGTIKVSGLALAGQKMRLYLNGGVFKEKEVDSEGKFEFDQVVLSADENTIGVQAIEEEKESEIAEVKIVYDAKKPEIEVTEPKEESQFFGKDQQSIVIVGKINESDAGVTINGNFVSVGSDGGFKYRTKLSEGVNEFVIVATDKAGNETKKKILHYIYSFCCCINTIRTQPQHEE